MKTLEADLNKYTIAEIRLGLDGIDEHPLRGSVASHKAFTGHGDMASNPGVMAGLNIEHFGANVHVRYTEVSNNHFTWDELVMKEDGLEGFGRALKAQLKLRTGH
jgi:hypothetical protein